MKEIQQHLIKIIRKLIKEEEDRNLNVRAARGYSVGHPYPVQKERKPDYGYVENKEQIESDDEPIKISRAFKKD